MAVILANIGSLSWIWQETRRDCKKGAVLRRRKIDNTLTDAWIAEGLMNGWEFLDKVGEANKRGTLKSVKFLAHGV